jgi:N utilization substance protein B
MPPAARDPGARGSRAGATRRRARELVLRALYQAETCGDPLARTWETVLAEERLPSETRAYVTELCRVLEERRGEIDATVRRHLEHWSFERLGATDRGVLRLAVAELIAMPGTPARVILDQAVDIARKYGGEESGPFVNGILDRLAREARPGELEDGVPARGEGRGRSA